MLMPLGSALQQGWRGCHASATPHATTNNILAEEASANDVALAVFAICALSCAALVCASLQHCSPGLLLLLLLNQQPPATQIIYC
jgi:hypothetical protein